MILLLFVLLSTNVVYQGGSFNLTLSEPAEVVLDDCMFFEHSLKNIENLTEGSYTVVASYACEGIRTILIKGASGEDRIKVEIRKTANYTEAVIGLQKEVIKLRRDKEALSSKISYLQSLVEIINSINVDLYDKIRVCAEENSQLKDELNRANFEIANYSKNLSAMNLTISELKKTVEELKTENSKLRSDLRYLESYLNNLAFYTDVFKLSTILLIAILFGIFLAFLRRY